MLRCAAVLPLVPLAVALGAAAPPPDAPPVPTVAMSLHPAAEPQPALRYTLLPAVAELETGNAATLYHRVLAGEINFLMQPGVAVQVDNWLKTPIKDLPRAEVRGLVAGPQLRELDVASRQSYCDWEFLNKLRRGGYSTLFGEIQKIRQIPQWLGARARLEMADGKPEQALETVKSILALARHLGEHPSVIGNLVGLAIAQIALNQLDDLVQQPGCPNLYWALTNLPSPLVDLRRGLQSEKLVLREVEFEGLLKNADAPLTPAQLQLCLDRLDKLRQISAVEGQNVPPAPVRQELAAREARELPAARAHLIAQGHSAAHVDSLPPQQVVLLYELFKFEKAQDDALKLAGLPFWQGREGLKTFEQSVKDRNGPHSASVFAPMWLNPHRVRQGQARVERRIAALRVVEAVRLYAAAHDGKLPAALKDLPVPVPTDPFTGRDFEYRLGDNKATLEGPTPAGEVSNLGNTLRYELTIK
jgi:hypothetical protein